MSIRKHFLTVPVGAIQVRSGAPGWESAPLVVVKYPLEAPWGGAVGSSRTDGQFTLQTPVSVPVPGFRTLGEIIDTCMLCEDAVMVTYVLGNESASENVPSGVGSTLDCLPGALSAPECWQ